MSNLYDKINKLCLEKGISITQMCKESGASRGSLGDLANNRIQTLSSTTIAKIADYFHVSGEWLTGRARYRSYGQMISYAWRDYIFKDSDFDPVFEFGPLLKKERELQGISPEHMADTVSCLVEGYIKIEEGKEPLSQDMAAMFCKRLSTTIDDILIDNNIIDQPMYNIDDEEEIMQRDILRAIRRVDHENNMQKLESAKRDLYHEELEGIKKYRELDKYGKEVVRFVINKEYERCTAPVESPKPSVPMLYIKHSEYKVSAGRGFDLGDYDSWEETEIPSTPESRRADFAVTVKGNSMEPIYYDGDIVLVKVQPTVNIGETGIFIVNGSGFIKQYGGDRLISINSEYNDILFSDGDTIKCAGKVIGTVKMQQGE